MDFQQLLNVLLHLSDHLAQISAEYGLWIYAILFLIIYCETGLVVTPFLPGDSLLFAAGSVAALGSMNVHLLVPLLVTAAFLGDNTNYFIGQLIGPKVFQYENSRFFKKAYLDKTHGFYEKYGGKTIILARFIPIIRTYAPFAAGVGSMSYRYFLSYSVIGALLWITSLTYAGFWFGNIPAVKQHFSIVILAIIVLSVSPMLIEWLKHKHKQYKKSPINHSKSQINSTQ
ncbi:DedA family protein [Piscirickettsia salmonis]|uniref:DedA family protein n=1 Tax=Piscirickettsia salmonis TaxID=1238 RepID=UPI0016625321|nr:DedA family protein [Piscirickettsia salmonis]QNR80360.1 DedA family protein [Piscirickettsia salmonis]